MKPLEGESAHQKAGDDRNGVLLRPEPCYHRSPDTPSNGKPPALFEETETYEQTRAAMLADRARRENKKRNLPRYAEGMTPRAAFIEGQRAKNRAAVERNIKAAEKAREQEARAAARLPRDPQAEAARAIFGALKNGSEAARRYATQLMKHAPDELRAAVMQLAEVDSEFKRRRSRRPNGF